MFVEHDRSYPDTVKALSETLAGSGVIQYNQLWWLVSKTILKYKQLAQESDMNSLETICRKKFEFGPPQ